MDTKYLRLGLFFLLLVFLPLINIAHGQEEEGDTKIEHNLKEGKVPLKTDDQVLERAEKFTFQAEVGRLMHIIVNSLYSNKEIFLRELISNASDALDKIRFLSLTDPAQLGDTSRLEIRIQADKKAKTLTITDTGIGMTKDDLVANLGTIAQSGTKSFIEKFQQSGGDSNLIGQFGVGFYSTFLVADRVTVYSKHNDDPEQHIWLANSPDSFSVGADPAGNTLGRGTKIVLHVKDDLDTDYLDDNVLKGLIKKYSEFINFPIYLFTTRVEKKEVPEEEKEAEPAEPTDELKVEEEEEEEAAAETKKEPKTVEEVIEEWSLMNENKPIWTRNPKDVTDEEYDSFFEAIAKGVGGSALAHVHFKGEGDVNFNSILYVPKESPYGIFDPSKSYKGLKLYVRRVFITDNFDTLMPKYLNFIMGVVDSDDLPLNVSREILQESKILDAIKKKVVRKAISMLQSVANDEPEKYKDLYAAYAHNIKYGIIEDASNRTRLSKLLRFFSSKNDELAVSLEDYIARMKEGQDQIYFLAGESREKLASSPLVENLVRKGIEVLYMVDPIDEYCLSQIDRFDGKYKLVNVAREGLKVDKDEEKQKKEKELKKEFEPLTTYLKTILGDKIEKAVISDRLHKSPSALVAGMYGYTANMERIMKAQPVQDKRFAHQMPKKTLELNPRHPLVIELFNRVKDNTEDPTAADVARLLYDTALLHSGFSLDEPATFADRIHRMLKLSLNLDPNADVPEEPEEELDEKMKEDEQDEDADQGKPEAKEEKKEEKKKDKDDKEKKDKDEKEKKDKKKKDKDEL
jgi:heat shock protein beta